MATDATTEQTTAAELFADESPGVSRLHTVAMMADILRVPPAAIRHWVHAGLLEPTRRSGGIAWFDFPQLVAGRQLARLLAAGLSLREIDARLRELAPGRAADAVRDGRRIVADGRRLSIRHERLLLGPGGQMQLAFYAEDLLATNAATEPATATVPLPEGAPGGPRRGGAAVRGRTCGTLPFPRRAPGWLDESGGPGDAAGPRARGITGQDPGAAAELVALAADLEADGAVEEAAEALRAALQAGGPSAAIMFMLAELLYRAGDLTAARERYYAAVELDADHLEARASLGCVLAELGEPELAIAALEGVLRQQPDYADAHWHLAGVLADAGRRAESRQHLRAFLRLAPESPWAAAARDRLAAHDRG